MKQFNTKTFSVVIPLYNKAAHIIDTIRSVMAQTFTDFEIVVVDDGSKDEGPQLVSQLQNDKVRLVRQPNMGVSAARNTGVREAQGQIIAFLDADDSWEPHFLAEINELVSQFPEARSYGTNYQLKTGPSEFVDPKIRFPSIPGKRFLIADYFDVGARGDLPFMMSSFCIQREFYFEVGGFQEGDAMGEDQDLFCRAALAAPIAYCHSILSFYHLDATNRACETIVTTDECRFSKRVKAVAAKEQNNTTKDSLLRYAASHLLHVAAQNIRGGQYDVARQILSDKTCVKQPVRYVWWSLRCLAGSVKAHFSFNRI